jgi:hypothetical protein
MATIARCFKISSLLAMAMLLVLLLPFKPCHADSYRWTDRDGTLHFSDTIPADTIPQESLDITDPAQRPLMSEMPPLYQDEVFRLLLISEKPDRLEFELEYSAIHRTYKDLIKGGVFVWIVAVDSARTPSWLAWTGANVESGNGRVKLVNTLSKQSPTSLETDSLILTLYRRDRAQGVEKTLFSKEIPFRKSWEKMPRITYR